MPDDVPFKDYVDARLTSIEQAVGVALTSSDKRFDSVNEWRQAYNDLIRGFPTRTEVDARFSAIEEKVDARLSAIDERIETMQRLVYIGLGAVAMLEILLRFLIK